MKIYIAGPISSNPDYKKDFEKAEKLLTMLGHTVFNPAKNEGDSYKDYIDQGLRQLMQCDTIYLLPGYKNSKGAMLEYQYAMATDMSIVVQG